MLPLQNRDQTGLTPATGWAGAAPGGHYPGASFGPATPPNAAPAVRLANLTNPPESCTALSAC